MAVVTSDLLFLTQAGIKTDFDAAFVQEMQKGQWNAIAEEIGTVLPVQKYAFMGRGAVMKPFIDETDEQSATEFDYTVSDILFKGNLTVQRKALEDEQYGLLMRRARGLASEAARHWDQLAFLGLVNGNLSTSLAYDNISFFTATARKDANGNTFANSTTNALSDSALETADKVMRSAIDDKGIPLGLEPDTLVVGPYLGRRAWDLTQSQVVVHAPGDGTAGSGATTYTPYANYFGGRYNVVISPYLINGSFIMPNSLGEPTTQAITAQYYWFLLDTKRMLKPIFIQNRTDVPITLETDMDVPTAKIKERYQFTIRGRYAQGYGLPQTAYGGFGTS